VTEGGGQKGLTAADNRSHAHGRQPIGVPKSGARQQPFHGGGRIAAHAAEARVAGDLHDTLVAPGEQRQIFNRLSDAGAERLCHRAAPPGDVGRRVSGKTRPIGWRIGSPADAGKAGSILRTKLEYPRHSGSRSEKRGEMTIVGGSRLESQPGQQCRDLGSRVGIHRGATEHPRGIVKYLQASALQVCHAEITLRVR
jgi:hypothetical protein